jgi:hypothetical protein
VSSIPVNEIQPWSHAGVESNGRRVEYLVQVEESLVPAQEHRGTVVTVHEWIWGDDPAAVLDVGSRLLFFFQHDPTRVAPFISDATFKIDDCGRIQRRVEPPAQTVWEELDGLPLQDLESVIAEIP